MSAGMGMLDAFNQMLVGMAEDHPELRGVSVTWIASEPRWVLKEDGYMEVPVLLSNGENFSFDIRMPKEALS